VRSRSETIGSLGRAPARQSKGPPPGEPLPPRLPPTSDRGSVRRWLRGALLENLGLKFLSMVLAVTVFLLVNTDRDREISARIGVSYTLPDDKVLVSDRLDEVRVTIKGPWQRLRKFDERELERINIDLRRAPAGDLAITPDMIHLPAGLVVSTISPHTVHIAFDRRVEKVVEVTPMVAGHPQHGYLVTEVKAIPATIKVRGAEGTLIALSAVRTHEVSVEGRAETFVSETEPVLPDGVELEGSPQIVLHVAVDEELVTRKLPGLAVGVRGDGVDPTKWQVKPSQVEVTLTGALLAVEKARAALTPVIKLTANDSKPREIEVSIEGVPPGIGVRISPERVKVAPAPKNP
jgi:YbbR domain-containing protein